MVGHEERQRLIQAYAEEPIRASAVIAKCAVCLALIAGIVAIGAFSPEDAMQAQGGARFVQVQPGAR